MTIQETRKVINTLNLPRDMKDDSRKADFADLTRIIGKMEIFQGTTYPLTEYDKLELAKLFRYRYYEAGECIRQAGQEQRNLYYILEGKCVVSFPQKEDTTKAKGDLRGGPDLRHAGTLQASPSPSKGTHLGSWNKQSGPSAFITQNEPAGSPLRLSADATR